MTTASSVVKITAKTSLKNNWINAIISCVTVIISYFICYSLTGIIDYIAGKITSGIMLFLLSLFLLLPLLLGLIRFFWRMILGADDSPLVVFYYFSHSVEYKKALYLIAYIVSRTLFFGIILFLPAIIVDVFSGAKVYDLLNISIPLWTSNLLYLSIFLKTVATIILILVLLRYYLAPFLIVADENMDVNEAIHMSVLISRNTETDLLSLILTFIGWIILSLLIFPIVFTMPYFMTSVSVHVRFAIADYNKKAETSGFQNIPTYAEGI